MKLKGNLTDALGLIAGGVGSAVAGKYIPIADEKIKAVIPIAAGFFLMGQKGIVGNIGKGLVAGGGASLAKSFGIAGLNDDSDVIEGIFEDYSSDDVLNGVDDGPLAGVDDGPLAGDDDDGY